MVEEAIHDEEADAGPACKLPDQGADWAGGMRISAECEGGGQPVTTLRGNVDQAALQGLLRRLYSLGLPLISVMCVDCDRCAAREGARE
jgi:hypothetical protein